MSQIMREYFFSAHPCGVAEFFHFRPYIAAVQWLARCRDENASACDAVLFCVFQKRLAELLLQKYHAMLALHAHLRLPGFSGFHRDELMLRDADARRAYGLH